MNLYLSCNILALFPPPPQNEALAASRREVASLVKQLETSQVERADAVNKLSRSLDESQAQCRQLMDSGANQELGRLKLQLQESAAARSLADDMSAALQDEVRELKEQLTMYESASRVGAIATTAADGADSKHMDDSYAQLGIKSGSSEGTPGAAFAGDSTHK